MTFELPQAETLAFWKTSRTDPDTWIDKAIAEIRKIDGQITGQAFGSETLSGSAAFVLCFTLCGEDFRITWPVLSCRQKTPENAQAAKRQAATFLFHDVKAKCAKAAIFGPRVAFFEHLLLPDGREAAQAATPELAGLIPGLLTPKLTDER